MTVVGLSEGDLPEIMIHDFRRNGYTPEVLLNFLALQGWSAGGDLEKMTVSEMVQKFSVDRINSSNPKFNREKLRSFSTDFFAAAPPERLVSALRDYLVVNPESPLNKATDEQLGIVLRISRGFHTLRDVDERGRFLFVADDELHYAPDAIAKILQKNDSEGAYALREVRALLESTPDFTGPALEAAVKAYCEQKQMGLGKVAQPIRVAVCGTAVSPPIFDCLEFLGRPSVLRRVDRALLSVK